MMHENAIFEFNLCRNFKTYNRRMIAGIERMITNPKMGDINLQVLNFSFGMEAAKNRATVSYSDNENIFISMQTIHNKIEKNKLIVATFSKGTDERKF